MSRAEASRKSARRVAGFPGGLAQQVRQASRVEEPLGDSQESESESASETGAQGGRAVKLKPKSKSRVKRPSWKSGTAPQKEGEELAEAIRWHRANALALKRKAEDLAGQARKSNRQALLYESQLEDPESLNIVVLVRWNQRISYSDSCCILWRDSREDWDRCEFGEFCDEGFWTEIRSAIPRRCRYDNDEAWRQNQAEPAGVKRARLCRDLGETAIDILKSRGQLKGNFEVVLPLVAPGAELSKAEFKEKIQKWQEALTALGDPPSFEEVYPRTELSDGDSPSELERVSGGDSPSGPVVPSLGRAFTAAEEADYQVVHGVPVRKSTRVPPANHWTSTESFARNAEGYPGGLPAYRGLFWGDEVAVTPTPVRQVISSEQADQRLAANPDWEHPGGPLSTVRPGDSEFPK
jgi:hypothetical protein